MTTEEQTVLIIKGAISELPPAQREACNELVEHVCRQMKLAGSPVGELALALVGAQLQLEAAKAGG